MNRAVVALAGLVAGCVAVLAGAATADAHAALESVSPPDGAMVTALPETVDLVFNEPVGTPADVVVLAPNGESLGASPPAFVDATVSLALDTSRPAPSGRYTISYQVTSLDGHLVSGTTTFMLHAGGEPAGPDDRVSAGGGPSTGADPWVVGGLAGMLAVVLVIALGAARRVLAAMPPAGP